MTEKKQKEKSEAEKEFEVLKEMFHAEHERWKKLYESHSAAHKNAMAAIKRDTTKLKPEEIIEEFGNYIRAYDETIYGKVKGGEEYSKKVAVGKARQHLERIAEQRRIPYEDFVEQLRGKELEEAFASYGRSSLERAISDLVGLILSEEVDSKDDKGKEMLAEQLRKSDMTRRYHSKEVVLAKLRDYLADYLIRYHQTTVPKPKKKGEK